MNESEKTNPFAVAVAESGGTMKIAQSRAAQEVQASMIIAKKFPRDEERAIERIRRSCQRRSLAEVACYAYPRGGTTVTGPSIRLAECLAQAWGNLDFGVIELDQEDGESTVMAYAWDTETNTRETKIFQVRHERRVGKGDKFQIVKLEDPRDQYELVANQGARRLRACILGIIPGDVVDIAVEQCEKTLSTNTEPLLDRARKMASAFDQYGVTIAMLEKRLGHKLEAVIEQELVNLRKIYTSIKDGAAKREDFFDVGAGEMKRPVFDGQQTSDDERAEAAAGLAPATPATPAEAPQQPRRRGRKPAAAEAQPPTQAPAPPPPPPVPNTAQPETPAAVAAATLPRSSSGNPLADQLYALLDRDKINETEILEILKRRKLAHPDWQMVLEVPDKTLQEEVLDRWEIMSAQARMDRKTKAAAQK